MSASTDWRVEAERLRAEGLTIRQIAERIGKARGTIGEHFKPHYCACGNRRGHKYDRCEDCRRHSDHEPRVAVDAMLIRMWRVGATAPEIAAVTGYSTGTVKSRVSELRAAGVDLPLRRPDRVEPMRALGRARSS